ncbi:SIS domain-containing protein [Paramicrobacterium chengjingii]|uniref:SIS domain-containing protein n=1 Tax=Paramicrobacterium chengjingii TaxID=2769067 RepID=UPI001423939C|nr:SIS domain-containing protein [Microbacterium chengjingii]
MERINYDRAVRDQPVNLERAHRSVLRALDSAPIEPWAPGDTVAVVAMGASSHSAHALVFALVAAGIRAFPLTASDASFYAHGSQPADHYVIVSESGRSPEPIEAARHFTRGRRIGITNVADSPLAEVVDVVLPLGNFDDAGVYTIGYSATLLAYALLCGRACDRSAEGLPEVPNRVAAGLEEFDAPAHRMAEKLRDTRTVDFVGQGMSLAAASEGALMFREALAIPAAAFDTYQYLHGPMEPLRAGSGLIIFGDGRELTLVDSVLDAGVQTCLITAASTSDLPRPTHENLEVIRLPDGVNGFVRSILEGLVSQLIVGHHAAVSGRVPGEFTYRQADTKLPVE